LTGEFAHGMMGSGFIYTNQDTLGRLRSYRQSYGRDQDQAKRSDRGTQRNIRQSSPYSPDRRSRSIWPT
jgi:hypothetical protein